MLTCISKFHYQKFKLKKYFKKRGGGGGAMTARKALTRRLQLLNAGSLHIAFGQLISGANNGPTDQLSN